MALSRRELTKFLQQKGRLFSAFVRPALWLFVFAVGFRGVYGVDAFTPVVMSPNVATLAIGRVRDATRWEGDRPTQATAMTLTLAWDHRAVDGTTAAEFLAEVRDILEQPYRLLVD